MQTLNLKCFSYYHFSTGGRFLESHGSTQRSTCSNNHNTLGMPQITIITRLDFSLQEYLSNDRFLSQPHSHFPKVTTGQIEPEAEVVESESICSSNVFAQSTHPGPQPHRISTQLPVYLIVRGRTTVVKDPVFIISTHIYMCIKYKPLILYHPLTQPIEKPTACTQGGSSI